MASFATVPAHADPPPGSGTSADDSTHHLDSQNATDQLGNSTSGEHDTDNDGPGKKKKGTKRRKVNHACLYCRRSHMTCDEGRPCQRWCESSRSSPVQYRRRAERRGQHKARDRAPLPRRTAILGQGQDICVRIRCFDFRHEPPHRRRTGSPWRVSSLPPRPPAEPLTSRSRTSSRATLQRDSTVLRP